MKIIVDENIPLITVNKLRKSGHDVRDIRGSKYEGLDDKELWKLTCKEKRLLITTDKGFSRHREQYHSGILIIRLHQPNRYKIHKRVILAFKRFSYTEWQGMIVTMRDKVMNISTVK